MSTVGWKCCVPGCSFALPKAGAKLLRQQKQAHVALEHADIPSADILRWAIRAGQETKRRNKGVERENRAA
eukprot:10774842-Alexandrium_andersonii.AAC.1